jgi:drug/metabolite transporter (DMT)-like permease
MSFGVVLALASALVWGAGDFIGGLAARRSHHVHVLAVSALSGVLMLLASAGLWREAVLPVRALWWAVPAGLSGAVGVASLYRGLSVGNAAVVAPIAAVIGASVPVIVGVFVEGWPRITQTVGFVFAIAGILSVTMSSTAGEGLKDGANEGFWAAGLAGVGFSGFFVFMARVPQGAVFIPLVVARVIGLTAAVFLLAARRLPLPSLTSNPIALLAGVLDAGGGVFFVLAKQWTRFDVAAVLSSLYPVSTVLLARAVQKEHIRPAQWMGVALCLAAVGLMVM